jgi:hypothetical protein
VRPLGDGLNRLGQGAAFPRQGVFHADGRLGDDGPLDDPFFFQFLQALAQHAVGDVGNRLAQRGEAAAGVEEHEDDGPAPAAADQLAGLVEPDAELRGSMWRHLPDGRAVTHE